MAPSLPTAQISRALANVADLHAAIRQTSAEIQAAQDEARQALAVIPPDQPPTQPGTV